VNPSTKILVINNDKDLGEALVFQLTLVEKYQIIEIRYENNELAQSIIIFATLSLSIHNPLH